MTLLASLRDAIVSTIKTALPSLKTCETHGGRFDEGELARWGVNAPAVLVCCTNLGMPDFGTGGIQAPAAFVAYVITRNEPGVARDVSALNIVQALNKLLVGQSWSSNDFVTEPDAIESRNLYSTAADKKGVNLWAVTWRQTVVLGNPDSLAELDAFIRFAGDATNTEDTVLMQTQGELEQPPEPEPEPEETP